MRAIAILAVPPVVIAILIIFGCLLPNAPLGAMSLSSPVKIAESPLLSEVIERERQKWKLPKGLIEGLIAHETGWSFNEHSFNPEKQSKCYRSAKTQSEKQRCGSRGLMQIVSYWHGGEHDTLEEHIARGAGILGKAFRSSRGDVFKTLGAYNGDRTGRYAASVIKNARRFGFRG